MKDLVDHPAEIPPETFSLEGNRSPSGSVFSGDDTAPFCVILRGHIDKKSSSLCRRSVVLSRVFSIPT